jgi:hypothetical protein
MTYFTGLQPLSLNLCIFGDQKEELIKPDLILKVMLIPGGWSTLPSSPQYAPWSQAVSESEDRLGGQLFGGCPAQKLKLFQS